MPMGFSSQNCVLPNDCSRKPPTSIATGGPIARVCVIALHLPHCLIEVGDQVLDVFDAHRQPHDLRSRARLAAVFVRKLPVRGRGGMDNQTARVADICEMAENPDAVYQIHSRIKAAAQSEGENGSGALRAILAMGGIERV